MSGLKFLFPTDGDFVNSRDGAWENGALWIPVKVSVDAVAGIVEEYRAKEV